MAKEFIQIELKPKSLRKRIDRFKSLTKSEYRSLLSKMANNAVITMKTLAPSRTGRLRASIRIKAKRTSFGEIDLRSTIVVGPTVRYGTYVDKGTSPSGGRYVPFLGRRLVTERADFGRHPGIRGTHFIDRTKDSLESKFKVSGENFVRKLKTSWDRTV